MKHFIEKENPKGWASATLGDVAHWGSGGTPARNSPHFYEGTIPWIKTGELGPKYIRGAEEHISEEAIQNSSAKVFPAGSVGIAMYGATIGKLSIWAINASTNQACAVAQPYDGVLNNEFLFYFLLSERRGLVEAGKGGAQPNISQGVLKNWPIRLPPLNEQHRIVTKIEELFSEFDNGIESLKTAQVQLKVHRQAVLKHAFDGKLTAEWREEHKDKLVSADEIVAHIKQEREARYQEQFADWKVAVKKWEAKGQKGKKPSKPRPPKPLSKLLDDVRGTLVDLPDYWLWDKLGWMTCGVEYGTAAKSSEVGLVPVIRMGNLQNGKIDWDDLVFTSDKEEIKKYTLNSGDVLFNRTNSPELVGKTAIYRGERPALFAGYLIRINQIETIAESQYVNLFLGSHVARQHGNTVKTDGVNQSNINGEKLQAYPFPYCSLAEQCEVVRILDEKLSLTDQLMQEIDAQLTKSNALRQSILKMAFSGQLVAQDPRDEPASVLLDKIKTAKEEQDKSNKNNKRKDAA